MSPSRTSRAHPRHVQPPRPPNAWIIYRSDKLRELPPQAPGAPRRAQADVSKMISQMWRTESDAVRAEYERRAEVKKAEHALLYPDYRFAPQKKEEKERIRAEAKAEREAERDRGRRNRNRSAAAYATPYTPLPAPYYPPYATPGPAGFPPSFPAASGPSGSAAPAESPANGGSEGTAQVLYMPYVPSRTPSVSTPAQSVPASPAVPPIYPPALPQMPSQPISNVFFQPPYPTLPMPQPSSNLTGLQITQAHFELTHAGAPASNGSQDTPNQHLSPLSPLDPPPSVNINIPHDRAVSWSSYGADMQALANGDSSLFRLHDFDTNLLENPQGELSIDMASSQSPSVRLEQMFEFLNAFNLVDSYLSYVGPAPAGVDASQAHGPSAFDAALAGAAQRDFNSFGSGDSLFQQYLDMEQLDPAAPAPRVPLEAVPPAYVPPAGAALSGHRRVAGSWKPGFAADADAEMWASAAAGGVPASR